MICVPSAGARELIRKPLLSLLMNLLNKHSILFPLSFPLHVFGSVGREEKT